MDNAFIEYDGENGAKVKEMFFTYSEEEKQQREVDSANAQLIFRPEFVPFYFAEQEKYSLTQTETLIYGFVRFYLARGGGGRFYFTNEQLAELFKCSVNTACLAIKNLKDKGLVDANYKIRSGGGSIRFLTMTRITASCDSESQPIVTKNHNLLWANKNKIKENKIKEFSTRIENGSQNINGEYGNTEINNMLFALKKTIGISAFVDSAIERNMARHCISLVHKLSPEEFQRRLDIILSDPFKHKNCNSIRYVYNQIKGFIEPVKIKPPLQPLWNPPA